MILVCKVELRRWGDLSFDSWPEEVLALGLHAE